MRLENEEPPSDEFRELRRNRIKRILKGKVNDTWRVFFPVHLLVCWYIAGYFNFSEWGDFQKAIYLLAAWSSTVALFGLAYNIRVALEARAWRLLGEDLDDSFSRR